MPRARKPNIEQGQDLEALVLEVLGAFFDLRAVGQQQGLVNESGAGTWGLLRLLKEEGPMTVPEVARMRSVSRQYIQKLANELIGDGLIEMVDNPAHKRSKRMRLTGAGERRFQTLSRKMRKFLVSLDTAFEAGEVEAATQTIAKLRQHL